MLRMIQDTDYILIADDQGGVVVFGATIDGSEVSEGGRAAPVRLSKESGAPRKLTELPWKSVRSRCVKQPLIQLKQQIKTQLDEAEDTHPDSVALRIEEFASIEIAPGVFDKDVLSQVFVTDTQHTSTARYRNFSKDFKTARGAKDLSDLLIRNGLTLKVNTGI